MRVAQSATYYKVTDCDIDLVTEWNDTTNCESGPNAATGNNAAERVPNINDGDFSMTVIFKPTDGVYAGLADGGNYAVTFYADKTLTGSTVVGTIAVEHFRLMGKVRDAFKAQITGKYNGGRAVTGL